MWPYFRKKKKKRKERKRVFADAVKLRCGHRADPLPMPSVFMRSRKFGCRHTERMLCDSGGRHWSDASTSQGTAQTVDKPQDLGEIREQILPQSPQREDGPADTLISDSSPPELCETIHFYCLKPFSSGTLLEQPHKMNTISKPEVLGAAIFDSKSGWGSVSGRKTLDTRRSCQGLPSRSLELRAKTIIFWG